MFISGLFFVMQMMMQDVETTDTTPLMEEVFSENCDTKQGVFDSNFGSPGGYI